MATFEIFTDADSGDEVGEDVEIEEYFEEFFFWKQRIKMTW